MMSRTASAPMPAQKTRPLRAPEPYFSSRYAELGLGELGHGRELLDLVARRADLVLAALGLDLARLAVARRCAAVHLDPRGRRSSGRSRVCSSASRRAELRPVTRSDSARTIFLSFVLGPTLPPFSPAPRIDLAGRLEGDRLLGDAGSRARRGAPGRACAAALISSRPVAIAAARAARRSAACGVLELVARGGGIAARSCSSASSALPSLAAALGLLVERLERAAPGILVDVGDDEEGEVEDPLEVARADVEQDPEAATACP